MVYKQTTQVPNFLFDMHLPSLTEAELKTVLVIIRQTTGWLDKKTGKRKTRDRMTHSQFMLKTGLSKRIITKTIQSLCTKKLIHVSDFEGQQLCSPMERKGKSYLFYGLQNPVHLLTPTSAEKLPEPVHGSAYNKTNYTKTTETKRTRYFAGHIAQLLR